MTNLFTFLKVGLCFLCLILTTPLFSQNILACPECESAFPDCQGLLDGTTGTLPLFPNPTGPYPLCYGGFVPNNTVWYAFVAGTSELVLQIDFRNCTQGDGGQAGIVSDCSDLDNSAIVCHGACPGPPSFYLESYDLEPGKVYFLWLDGCAGASCDYTINIISGSTYLGPPDQTLPIIGPSQICDLDAPTVYEALPVFGATEYIWITPGNFPLHIDGNYLTVETWDFTGEVQFCVKAINSCYQNNTTECINVSVGSTIPPTDVHVSYCARDLGCFHEGEFYTAGFYEVVLQSSSGCDSIIYLTVEEIQSPSSDSLAAICIGDEYEYNGQIYTLPVSGLETIITTPDPDDCDSVVVFSLEVLSPHATISGPDFLDCEQGINTITLASSGNVGGAYHVSFEWFTSDGLICDGIADLPSISVCEAGEYCLLVTHVSSTGYSCEDQICKTITAQSQGPQITLTASPASCGLSDGSIQIDVVNGIPPYTYEWEGPNGTVDQVNQLSTGEYFITVTAANGCQSTDRITIDNVTTIEIEPIAISNPQCNGNADGSISILALNGTPPLDIQWSPNANGQTGTDITGLTGGQYTVTVTDTDNCSASATFTLMGSSAITLTTNVNNVLCTGDASGWARVMTNGGTAPYNIQWDANTGNQTGSTVTNLSGGDYSVTVTDANACTATTSISISEPPVFIATIASTVDLDCFGEQNGEATIQVSGGNPVYTVRWDANAGNQTGLTAFDLGAGTYSVTIEDANDCGVVLNATINSPEELTLHTVVEQATTCFGTATGYGRVLAQGGTPSYSYSWNSSTANIVGPEAFGLLAGDYIVTVTDELACTTTTLVNIDEGPMLYVLIVQTQSIDCFGDQTGKIQAIVNGGSGNYSYSWSANANGSTSPNLSNLGAGAYALTVIDDNGCDASTNYQLTQPDILDADIDVLPASPGQADGEATASALGGTPPYFYLWLTDPPQASPFVGGLAAGNYQLLIQDVNNCETWITVQVGEY